MILGYLILGHLMGDFILQTEALVKLKQRSKNGTIVHVLIHFLISNLLLLPLILQGAYELITASFLISFLHFWIDQAKINYSLKHDKKVKPFLLDQLSHLVTIFLVFSLITTPIALPDSTFFQIYSNISLIVFLNLLIVFSTALDVYFYQLASEKDKKAKLTFNRRKILYRLLIFSLLYGSLLLLLCYFSS